MQSLAACALLCHQLVCERLLPITICTRFGAARGEVRAMCQGVIISGSGA
jgi:hypothetical protein